MVLKCSPSFTKFNRNFANFTEILPISPKFCQFHQNFANFTKILPISPNFQIFQNFTNFSKNFKIFKMSFFSKFHKFFKISQNWQKISVQFGETWRTFEVHNSSNLSICLMRSSVFLQPSWSKHMFIELLCFPPICEI